MRVASPVGSLAAMRTRSRASRGSAATRLWKLSSIPACTGAAAGTPKPPASCDGARRLHQGQVRASCRDDEPIQDLVVQWGGQDRLEQRAGVAMTEWFDVDLGQ